MGIPGKAVPSDDVLRSAVGRGWEAAGASLHTLSDEIGLSPAGLLKFLNGAVPRPSTRKKLLSWYAGQPPVQGEPELAAAEPLFARLLPGLTDEDRVRLIRQLASRAAEAYRRRGTAPPRWVAELEGA
ncbi:MAG TPA: hypothetical protein VEX86_26830 [Longimicrobium sp.]|nr:hypothetical protein [Longimicrobium sp.]